MGLPCGRGSDREMSPLGQMPEQVPLPWWPARGVVQTVVSPVPETALGGEGRSQGSTGGVSRETSKQSLFSGGRHVGIFC